MSCCGGELLHRALRTPLNAGLAGRWGGPVATHCFLGAAVTDRRRSRPTPLRTRNAKSSGAEQRWSQAWHLFCGPLHVRLRVLQSSTLYSPGQGVW